MKSMLKTLHKLREMRRVTALSRVNEQSAVVAESADALSRVEQEVLERVQREHNHQRALNERAARGNACAADLVSGRLHGRQLQQQTMEAGERLLDMERAHRIEEDTAQVLRKLLNRADAEVQSIEKAEERYTKEARRRSDRRDEDTIDDVSLTRHATRRN
jgi:hypothetical protein